MASGSSAAAGRTGTTPAPLHGLTALQHQRVARLHNASLRAQQDKANAAQEALHVAQNTPWHLVRARQRRAAKERVRLRNEEKLRRERQYRIDRDWPVLPSSTLSEIETRQQAREALSAKLKGRTKRSAIEQIVGSGGLHAWKEKTITNHAAQVVPTEYDWTWRQKQFRPEERVSERVDRMVGHMIDDQNLQEQLRHDREAFVRKEGRSMRRSAAADRDRVPVGLAIRPFAKSALPIAHARKAIVRSTTSATGLGKSSGSSFAASESRDGSNKARISEADHTVIGYQTEPTPSNAPEAPSKISPRKLAYEVALFVDEEDGPDELVDNLSSVAGSSRVDTDAVAKHVKQQSQFTQELEQDLDEIESYGESVDDGTGDDEYDTKSPGEEVDDELDDYLSAQWLDSFLHKTAEDVFTTVAKRFTPDGVVEVEDIGQLKQQVIDDVKQEWAVGMWLEDDKVSSEPKSIDLKVFRDKFGPTRTQRLEHFIAKGAKALQTPKATAFARMARARAAVSTSSRTRSASVAGRKATGFRPGVDVPGKLDLFQDNDAKADSDDNAHDNQQEDDDVEDEEEATDALKVIQDHIINPGESITFPWNEAQVRAALGPDWRRSFTAAFAGGIGLGAAAVKGPSAVAKKTLGVSSAFRNLRSSLPSLGGGIPGLFDTVSSTDDDSTEDEDSNDSEQQPPLDRFLPGRYGGTPATLCQPTRSYVPQYPPDSQTYPQMWKRAVPGRDAAFIEATNKENFKDTLEIERDANENERNWNWTRLKQTNRGHLVLPDLMEFDKEYDYYDHDRVVNDYRELPEQCAPVTIDPNVSHIMSRAWPLQYDGEAWENSREPLNLSDQEDPSGERETPVERVVVYDYAMPGFTRVDLPRSVKDDLASAGAGGSGATTSNTDLLAAGTRIHDFGSSSPESATADEFGASIRGWPTGSVNTTNEASALRPEADVRDSVLPDHNHHHGPDNTADPTTVESESAADLEKLARAFDKYADRLQHEFDPTAPDALEKKKQLDIAQKKAREYNEQAAAAQTADFEKLHRGRRFDPLPVKPRKLPGVFRKQTNKTKQAEQVGAASPDMWRRSHVVDQTVASTERTPVPSIGPTSNRPLPPLSGIGPVQRFDWAIDPPLHAATDTGGKSDQKIDVLHPSNPAEPTNLFDVSSRPGWAPFGRREIEPEKPVVPGSPELAPSPEPEPTAVSISPIGRSSRKRSAEEVEEDWETEEDVVTLSWTSESSSDELTVKKSPSKKAKPSLSPDERHRLLHAHANMQAVRHALDILMQELLLIDAGAEQPTKADVIKYREQLGSLSDSWLENASVCEQGASVHELYSISNETQAWYAKIMTDIVALENRLGKLELQIHKEQTASPEPKQPIPFTTNAGNIPPEAQRMASVSVESLNRKPRNQKKKKKEPKKDGNKTKTLGSGKAPIVLDDPKDNVQGDKNETALEEFAKRQVGRLKKKGNMI